VSLPAASVVTRPLLNAYQTLVTQCLAVGKWVADHGISPVPAAPSPFSVIWENPALEMSSQASRKTTEQFTVGFQGGDWRTPT